MNIVRAALLAGTAAISLTGFPRIAAARDPATHVMTVQLPDGELAQIRYVGDVAPRLMFAPAPEPSSVPPADLFGAGSPFAMLQAMSAEMDQQMAGLMRQVPMMAAPSAQSLTAASFGQLPAGVTEFRSLSTFGPNGVCTRTIRVTSAGEGLQPREVSQTSGDCGRTALPAETAPAPTHNPHTIEVRDQAPQPPKPTWHG